MRLKNLPKTSCPYSGKLKFIETEDELREFMRFREKKAKEKLNANNG